MANNKNVAEDHDRKKLIKLLRSKAQTINIHGDKIHKARETIITSCQKHGTKGDAHKSQLFAVTEEMNRLVALYRSIEKKYEDAAIKLEGESQVNKVLTDLHGYIVFCNDQIKAEQEGYKRIISLLRD